MALRFPRETSDSERASGIRSSGVGNADVRVPLLSRTASVSERPAPGSVSFIGIVDVQTVRVEGMNMPLLAADAVPRANKAVEELAL